MPHSDSIDKIVTAYFAGISRSPFSYKGKVYEPKTLVVSPLLLRGYTCPEHCGGCCPRFSLDYIADEEKPYELKAREVQFNNKKIIIYSDEQKDHQNHHCRNLIHENGRCGVHGKQPFSCDFELIRFLHFENKTVLTQRLFGRGWQFLRTDGERGARCEMTPVTKETISEVLRKLRRLKQWASYFGLDHCMDSIIDWVRLGDHNENFLIPKDAKRGILTKSLIEFTDEPLIQIKQQEK